MNLHTLLSRPWSISGAAAIRARQAGSCRASIALFKLLTLLRQDAKGSLCQPSHTKQGYRVARTVPQAVWDNQSWASVDELQHAKAEGEPETAQLSSVRVQWLQTARSESFGNCQTAIQIGTPLSPTWAMQPTSDGQKQSDAPEEAEEQEQAALLPHRGTSSLESEVGQGHQGMQGYTDRGLRPYLQVLPLAVHVAVSSTLAAWKGVDAVAGSWAGDAFTRLTSSPMSAPSALQAAQVDQRA